MKKTHHLCKNKKGLTPIQNLEVHQIQVLEWNFICIWERGDEAHSLDKHVEDVYCNVYDIRDTRVQSEKGPLPLLAC